MLLAARGTVGGPPTEIEYLAIGGGGGGGTQGGGGGAAAFTDRYGTSGTTFSVTAATSYTLTIGAGGAANTAGSNTTMVPPIAVPSQPQSLGGGYGGRASGGANVNGGDGGSGGGAAVSATSGTGGAGQTVFLVVRGYAGGANAGNVPRYGGGGGGGADAVGANGTLSTGGNGGIGRSSSITGSAVTYCGGGGGGIFTGAVPLVVTAGTGGSSIGGNGSIGNANATNGAVNTGSGGGGTGTNVGVVGTGGSGILIIAYPDSYTNLVSVGAGLTCNGSAGNTVPDTASRPGYKVYKFTAGTGTISW